MSTDLIKGGTISGAVQGIRSGRSIPSSQDARVIDIATAKTAVTASYIVGK